MLTLKELKGYLRIDSDNTLDDTFLNTQILVAQTVLNKITKRTSYGDRQQLANLYMMAFIGEIYENRELTEDKVVNKLSYTMATILNELKWGVYND